MTLTSANGSGSHDRLPRAGWISARARNASRRVGRISLVGGLALLTTALVLVFLPRGADRIVRAELNRLAPPTDTVALLTRLDSLITERAQARLADSLRTDSLRANPVARAIGVTSVDSTSVDSTSVDSTSVDSRSVNSTTAVRAAVPPAPPDPAMRELRQLLQRAGDVPLVESYRALAQAAALRSDGRARALADSLETLHREREAYAALGGADARYAALTTQIAALGQRLVRQGALRLRAAQQPAAVSARMLTDSARIAGTDSTVASISSVTSTVASSVTASASLPAAVAAAALSAAREDTRLRAASVERTLRAQLAEARRENARVAARRTTLESQLSASVPPAAVLLAALVVGVSLGFASALLREVRQPTVSDEAELERLTGARVIAASPPKSRRRAQTSGPSVRDDVNAAYPLVHLALTGIGEVARVVEIVAESRKTAAIVAVQVGLVAAGESRAVAIVDRADAPAVVTRLLRERYGLHVPAAPSAGTTRHAERQVTTVTIDRDLSIDLRPVVLDGAPETDAYDLTLMPQDAQGFSGADAVVCVRLGETSLAWLSAVVRQARLRGVRIRAVLLWVGGAPGQ